MFNVNANLQTLHFWVAIRPWKRLIDRHFGKIVFLIKKIISGGQTGADRAALDFAIANGIPHGGWCPQGRFAEDGKIAKRYLLQETPTPNYPERTEWNVRDSDGTLICSVADKLLGGSRLTYWMTTKHKKPCLHLSKERDGNHAAEKLREFIQRYHIKTLNVAGPRASTEAGIARFTKEVLTAALKQQRT